MSKILEHIRQNKSDSQRLTGLKYEQLEKLLEKAAKLHQEKQAQSSLKKIRIINAGGGRKPKLSVEDQIMLTLTYLRHLPTFQLLGVQFGVSETTANDKFNYWMPIIGELLPASLIEQVKKKK
jgi:hypothetical protein